MSEAFDDPTEKPYLFGEQQLPLDRHQACLDAVKGVEAFLDANVAALGAATSAADVELARVALLSLRANDDEYYWLLRDPVKAYDARDAGMAKVFTRLRALRAPGKRAAIWAHNRHVAARPGELAPAEDDFAWRAMGSHLSDALGDKYAAVGLVAHQVELNWDGRQETTLPPRDGEDHIERPLSALGKSHLLVDLESNGVLTLGKPYEMGDYGGTGVPRRHYRALIFLERSPAQKAFF